MDQTNENRVDDDTENFDKGLTELDIQVRSLEIPFNWNLYQEGPHRDNIIGRLEEKDEEIIDPLEFKFRNFTLQIILAYEYFNRAENVDETSKTKTRLSALQILKDCENVLHKLKLNDCKESLFVLTYEPLFNITLGCKAFTAIKCGMASEAREALKQLLPVGISNEQTAASLGIKASIIMEYGNDKFPTALEYAIKARNLDPSVAEWHFLVGNLMARIRRVKQFMDTPQKEEIISLEKAVEISGCQRFKLHLAQSYREEGFRIFNTYRYDVKKNPDKEAQVKNLNQKSINTYRTLIDENPDDARLLARCAFGITKLPIPFRDVSLAKQTIEKALERAPNNPMINHYFGIIYERYVFNFEEAEKYYKTAADLGVYGATMDFARLKFSQNPTAYDPVPYLKVVAETFLEKDRHFQTISQIASYYFFHKHDIPEAWKYIQEIVATSPQHSCLRTHKSITLRMNDPCDLCEVVFDDVKFKIAHQKYETDIQKENLMRIGCSLRKLCPNSHIYLYAHLKNKILDKSKSLREGRSRNNRKSRQFFNKGKGRGKGGKSNSKPRTNLDQNQWSGNRDRSKSTNNRRVSQERGAGNSSRSHSKNKNVKKNQSRNNSLEKIPSDLKFSGELAAKWQTGSDGINTGVELDWYGPYFKPKSRDSSLTKTSVFRNSSKSPVSRLSDNAAARKFPGNQCLSSETRPPHMHSNYNSRSQSLGRYNSHSFSESGTPKWDGYRAKNFYLGEARNITKSLSDFSNPQNYFRGKQDNRNKFQSTERQKSKFSASSENVSSGRQSGGTRPFNSRNSSSDRNVTHNYHNKNNRAEEQFQRQSCDFKNINKCPGDQPPSRDSSVESRASLFLPKFGSRTSVHNISDNEQEQN